jgi:hypothetical protein
VLPIRELADQTCQESGQIQRQELMWGRGGMNTECVVEDGGVRRGTKNREIISMRGLGWLGFHDNMHTNNVDPRSRRVRSARAHTRVPLPTQRQSELWCTACSRGAMPGPVLVVVVVVQLHGQGFVKTKPALVICDLKNILN